MPTHTLTVHDDLPPAESALVDQGLGAANHAAAPLHQVRPLSCFARDEAGTVRFLMIKGGGGVP